MILRGETEWGSWELVHRAPHPLLAPYVRSGYEGFTQAMRRPVRIQFNSRRCRRR